MELDSLTILYIIIALSIVQFLLMRYYVASSLETEIHHNNKRLIKRMTGQIQTTLQQHLGGNASPTNGYEPNGYEQNGYEPIPSNKPAVRRPSPPNHYREPELPAHDTDADNQMDNQMDSMEDPIGADDEAQ